MTVEHVVDAGIVVDGNGNRVSSYSGSNTSCFQFDTKRVLELFNYKILVYLKNSQGYSNAAYISGIKASKHDDGIIIDAIEFEYYYNSITNIDIDRPFYPSDFIGTMDKTKIKWTLYVKEDTFNEDKKEKIEMPDESKSNNSIIIKPKDPETTKGIRPFKHYEFDPEYFYKLCAFTVIDLRTDPVTRYECILIETNPTYLVFAAFDSEKEYSSKGAFNNIKRLTINMDRYMTGEFQIIRHAWEEG